MRETLYNHGYPTLYRVTLYPDWDGNVRTWEFEPDEFDVAIALHDSLLLLQKDENVRWEVEY